MLRITIEESGELTRFRLEGKLKNNWVRELVHCWTSPLNTGPEKHLAVELSNVNFIDENGRALLSCMFSQGARLEAHANLITSALIEEITNDLRLQGNYVAASMKAVLVLQRLEDQLREAVSVNEIG
jgi:hypothetical protein